MLVQYSASLNMFGKSVSPVKRMNSVLQKAKKPQNFSRINEVLLKSSINLFHNAILHNVNKIC